MMKGIFRWRLFLSKPVSARALICVMIAINLVIIYFVQFNTVFHDAHRNIHHDIHHSLHGDNNDAQSAAGSPELTNHKQPFHIPSLINQTRPLISLEQFWRGEKTGNPLIDDYGQTSPDVIGEMGLGVVLTVDDKENVEKALKDFHVNTRVSDKIPINRRVPDSRIDGCDKLHYDVHGLPKTSVIIPFYEEWPSVLLRTVYSVINRTPRQLLQEIILVDDASPLEQLQQPLEDYVNAQFPKGLVRLVRVPQREGLIKARMKGVQVASGEVLVFFDSHMEVNIDWLPPLLTEVKMNSTTIAMATLDYIQADTFEYRYNLNYLTRYGWDWRMVFFETFFRDDQLGPNGNTTTPRLGASMVGAAFAVNKDFFTRLGGYDEGMTVWGGENLEMSWRVWMCGGRLMHVPCSRIGHIARSQPYSFPGGRGNIEHYNYKRAASVWMGNYSKFLYHTYPDMKTLDVGDISPRLAIKEKLHCQDFSWYIHNVWPELNIYDEDVSAWGFVANEGSGQCLDNSHYLFQALSTLYLQPCSGSITRQGFSLKKDGALKTTLQCVVVVTAADGADVQLEDCIIGHHTKWTYTEGHALIHVDSQLCMDVATQGAVLSTCVTDKPSQKWMFNAIAF